MHKVLYFFHHKSQDNPYYYIWLLYCVHVLCCAESLSHAMPWTVAHQAPLPTGILQARILEWVACPPPGDLPNSGIELRSPTLKADSLLSHQGNPRILQWVAYPFSRDIVCVCMQKCHFIHYIIIL